jgi:hypothetical protein
VINRNHDNRARRTLDELPGIFIHIAPLQPTPYILLGILMYVRGATRPTLWPLMRSSIIIIISIPSPTSTTTSSTSISPVYASHSHHQRHVYRITHTHVYTYTYVHMSMYVYVACIPPVTGPGEDASPLYMYHTRWYICEDKRPQAPQHGQQHGVSIAVSLMRSTLERDPPSRFRRAPIA